MAQLEDSVATLQREPGKKKRIIICCDGTWQASDRPSGKDGKSSNVVSNVTNMCRALAKEDSVNGDGIQQVVYYQSGVGTDTITALSAGLAGKLLSHLNRRTSR